MNIMRLCSYKHKHTISHVDFGFLLAEITGSYSMFLTFMSYVYQTGLKGLLIL